MRERVYKTLGARIIYIPKSPPSLYISVYLLVCGLCEIDKWDKTWECQETNPFQIIHVNIVPIYICSLKIHKSIIYSNRID